jgi:DNA polymerase (family 10)
MALTNQAIADMLRQTADLLEGYGDNPYRVRAYRKAAYTVDHLEKELTLLKEEGVVFTLFPNIGKSIAAVIDDILITGTLPNFYTKKFEKKLLYNELIRIEGLGKKRLALLASIGITSIAELLIAIKNKKIFELKGFTEPLIKKILTSVHSPKHYEKFFRYKIGAMLLKQLINYVETIPGVTVVTITGSFRRKVDLIGNVTILIQTTKPANLFEKCLKMKQIQTIIAHNKTELLVRLQSNLQVKLQITPKKYWGIQLLFHTGSLAHVKRLQILALQKNYQLTEKGLFHKKHYTPVKNEAAIFAHLGLPFIPPELREDRGEIEAGLTNTLPELITLQAIKGDLHSHTNETDGTEKLEIMVEAAISLGYEYLAITDHSERLAITNGLTKERLKQQIKLIDKLNAKYSNFTILKSIEVDILEDGSLDLSNDILKELDIRVCSLHSKFKLPIAVQTERILRAMDNPYFNILGHPTGRLLTSRKPYPIDMDKIMLGAKERGCFLELNAQPSRLDIHDEYCLKAKKMGLKVAISSDAHSVPELKYMEFGINQARRGWLEPHDVINTRPLKELKKLLQR